MLFYLGGAQKRAQFFNASPTLRQRDGSGVGTGRVALIEAEERGLEEAARRRCHEHGLIRKRLREPEKERSGLSVESQL
jgi:hypothetical protein